MESNTRIIENKKSPFKKLDSINISDVTWTDGFWKKRYEVCKKTTLMHLLKRLKDPKTGHVLSNMRIYAGLENGEFQGRDWSDAWLFKWIESAAYIYSDTKDKKLDKTMDDLIEIIARAQENDGYIASQILQRKERAWTNELYREFDTVKMSKIKVRLIPYYTWANRGVSEMSIWLPLS